MDCLLEGKVELDLKSGSHMHSLLYLLKSDIKENALLKSHWIQNSIGNLHCEQFKTKTR